MIKRREFEQACRAQIIETAYERGVIDLPAAADAFALVRDRDREPARLNAKLDELEDLTWRTYCSLDDVDANISGQRRIGTQKPM